eukprot:606978-Pyramimonas_sp.AAC.1
MPRTEGHSCPRSLLRVADRRHRKRCEGVRAVKRTDDYIAAVAHWGANRPATPDPWNRRLAKRMWESRMQAWRVDLEIAANRNLEDLAERVAELALE